MESFSWPNGAPFAVCLTHDVDHIKRHLYQRLWRGANCGFHIALRELRDLAATIGQTNSAWNFERIMSLEEKLGVRSTFLFMDETASGFGPQYWGRYRFSSPSVQSIIKELDSGGWEIGLHGSLYSYNHLELLQREKNDLEQIISKPIVSTRQHYLNFEKGITFAIQEQIGLKVDSTIGYSHKPYDGNLGVFPYTPEERNITELPITIMDTIGIEQADVRSQCEKNIRSIAKQGGLITLDWHQCICNPNLFPERFSFYQDIISFALRNKAWIAPMRDIARHYKKLNAL